MDDNVPFLSFPSIRQFRHVLKELPYVLGENIPEVLQFQGSIKLHGTHADVVRHIQTDGNHIDVIQSRNRILSLESDNQGCFGFLTSKNWDDLFQQVANIHGNTVLSHIMICGEYCGEGIQNKVAICKLKKMFVIFAIKIDNQWVDMDKYKNVQCELESIYNILNFPLYEIELNTNDPEKAEEYMAKLTNQIDVECPFAKALAGISGPGEGVVWKCMMMPSSSRLWFKTKGQTHCATMTRKPEVTKEETCNFMKTFLDCTLTEARLCQGIAYLIEMEYTIDIVSISTFIYWVTDDIIKEEMDIIEEHQLKNSEIKKAVSKIAGTWYRNRLIMT
jgi:hypothetical protein